MSRAVRLTDELFIDAQSQSKAMRRSVAGQIEYWARIGKIAEENPDLPFTMIRDILLASEEVRKNEIEEYIFDEGKSKG